MEEEISVVVQEFWMKLVHHGDGLGDAARLDGVADLDAAVHLAQVHGGGDVGLVAEFFGRLLEAL